jgi:hypothetical protein
MTDAYVDPFRTLPDRRHVVRQNAAGYVQWLESVDIASVEAFGWFALMQNTPADEAVWEMGGRGAATIEAVCRLLRALITGEHEGTAAPGRRDLRPFKRLLRELETLERATGGLLHQELEALERSKNDGSPS